MIFRLLALMVFLSLIIGVQNANACSPKEWSYNILSKGSIAMIYGEVSDTSNDERTATVKVINFVGSAIAAPKVVYLPSTQSSQKNIEDTCPDFSTTFQKGKKYIVFLKGTGQSLELLHISGTTALEVEDNKVIVNTQGEIESVSALIQRYATDHQQTIKEPDYDAGSWGKEQTSVFLIIIAAITVISIIIIFLYVTIRRAKMR